MMAIRPRARATAAALLLAAFALGGCIRLLPDPGDAPAVIALGADPALTRVAETAPLTLGVGLPTMPAALAGSRVAAVSDDGAIAYVEGVRLASVAPLSIQDVVLGTADRMGLTRAAVRAVTIARPDYELHFDISTFVVTVPRGSRPGVARIQGAARLVEVATGRPIASNVFDVETPAPRGAPTQAARGLEAATRVFARQALEWAVPVARLAQTSRAASATR